MTDWKDISTAPKDGTRVWVKLVYDDQVITEGWAVWGAAHGQAPQRQPEIPDPLGRPPLMTPEQHAAYAGTPKWMSEDRMFTFPTPTHWRPEQ